MRVLGEELLLRAAPTLRARRLGVDGTAIARRDGHPNLGAHINPFQSSFPRLSPTLPARREAETVEDLRRPHGAHARADGGGDRPSPSSAGAALLTPRVRHGESRHPDSAHIRAWDKFGQNRYMRRT